MYLGYKDICEFLDGIVAITARLQGFCATLPEAGQEVTVQLQQAVQLGKQTVQLHVVQL